MSMRTVMVIVMAVICGGSAAVGVNHLAQQRKQTVSVETVDVLVATTDMPRGALLSAEHLSVKKWPKAMVPKGALSDKEAAADRTIMIPLVAGEPILEAKLTSGAHPGLASMIPRGMRAFTIRTPTVQAGVGGFILPGNKVDVLLTTRGYGANDPTGGGSTTTLLQNVQVLAADSRLDADEKRDVDRGALKSVTLLVTPNQAAKLDLGMNQGELHLALRNPEDNEEAYTRPATLAELRFHQESPNQDVSSLGKVMGALTNAFAGANAARVDDRADSETVARKPRRRYHIQTIRGAHRGSIVVEKK